MFPIKNVKRLPNLNELDLLQNQVHVVRLQDKLGEQNYHRDRRNIFEPMTDAIKRTSRDIKNLITEISIKNNMVQERLNEKILNFLNEKGMVAPFLASFLVNRFKPEN